MCGNSSQTRAARVLVVDDVPGNRAVMARRLSRHGYRIIEAASGKEALELLRGELPHIILLDYMMPEMSGIDLLQILKSDQRTQHIPVIMVTARAEGASTDAALRAGAEDYVTKPIDFVALDARMSCVLERTQKASEIRKINEALDNRVVMRVLQLAQMHEELQSERLRCSRLQSEMAAQSQPHARCDAECREGTLALVANIEHLLKQMMEVSTNNAAVPNELLTETTLLVHSIRQRMQSRQSLDGA